MKSFFPITLIVLLSFVPPIHAVVPDPDPEETKIPSGDVGNEEPPGTFTFVVTAKLKRPLKL